MRHLSSTFPPIFPATRRSVVIAALAVATGVGGCSNRGGASERLNEWKLASGRAVRPIQVQRSSPEIDPPFLLLAYATSVDLDDTVALRKEAYAVWPRFLPIVRHAAVSKAVLQANGSPFRVTLPFLAWIGRQRRFTFVLNKDPDGTWRVSGDTVALSGGSDTTFSLFGTKCKIAPLGPRQLGAPRCIRPSILALPDSR